MSDADRRIAQRHRVTFGAVVDPGDGVLSGRVLDLSLTGAFIHADAMLPLGTEFVLFPLDDAADELFELHGRVVRHVQSPDLTQAPGMGVEFVGLTGRQRRALARLMGSLPMTSYQSLTHMPVQRDLDALDDAEGRGTNRAWSRIGIRLFSARQAG